MSVNTMNGDVTWTPKSFFHSGKVCSKPHKFCDDGLNRSQLLCDLYVIILGWRPNICKRQLPKVPLARTVEERSCRKLLNSEYCCKYLVCKSCDKMGWDLPCLLVVCLAMEPQTPFFKFKNLPE